MGRKNMVGVALCVTIFVGSFATANGAAYFLNATGLIIVLSGTLGAALVSFPWDSLKAAARVGWNSYTVDAPTPDDVVQTLTKFSVRSRYDGILGLERFEGETTASFLKGALELMVDGYDKTELREILCTELSFFRQRRLQHERVFRHLGRLAPAFGVAGSVIGLMSMLFGIGDSAIVLRTIPLALTSTLYGIVIANFLLIPVGESIHFKTMRESLIMRLTIDGVTAILEEENPRRLEKRLDAFISPSFRTGNERSLEEIRNRYAERQAREELARQD